ncbi:uncharacterized protein LOC120769711 [Bactrocera tryoni]|uniref:uncharacterized protein LOC120769711 n=1 Tax=Bactrocera tryoni TaxID=59916 RepID=UPI001A96827D|nr:uncharacterized protein LOC120769711 [Bactrocera tryoni]
MSRLSFLFCITTNGYRISGESTLYVPRTTHEAMIYYVLLLLPMYCIEAKIEQHGQYDMISNTTTTAMNFEEIGEELHRYTWQIPYLNVLLRAKQLESDDANPYVRWFLRHNNLPLIIKVYDELDLVNKTQLSLSVKSNRDSFVIMTDSQQLAKVAQRFVQRAGVFFFILSDTQLPADNSNVLHALNTLWTKYRAFKNFLLTVEGIFYFNPFDYNYTRQSYGKIVRYEHSESLDTALFRDMHGYPLRVQIFKSVYARPYFNKSNPSIKDVYGVDGRVAELLQQRMNFTMALQEPDPNYFGERSKDGKYNGAIGAIIEDKIDLCLTGFFIKDYLVGDYMDFTVAVYDDQLCIYVPKAQRVPQSILPLFSVNVDVWLGFILTAFVCCVIWCIIRQLNIYLNIRKCADTPLERSQWWQFVRIYIDTWVLWVRVNLVQYPPFNSERIFIASLCLVSVIFGAIFESSLATVFIHPLYYNDINTLQQLDESNLKVIYKYSSMADDLFFSETSPLFANLNKKLVHVQNLNADVILDIAKNGGKAGVSRANSLLLESLQFILSKQVYIVPECPKDYTISYVIPKDAPWEEAINNLLLQFASLGLIKKWINDMKTAVDIDIMKSGMDFEQTNTFKVLTVNDLQLAFYVVILGNSLAGLSLIIEFCLKRCSKCTKIKMKDDGI